MTYSTYVVVNNLVFPESPRWHQDRFWFADQFTGDVLTLSLDGLVEIVTTLSDHVGGIGWLPDGTLLVVGMTERLLHRLAPQGLEVYANLSGLASFHCNDLLVDAQGGAYVSEFGYDMLGGAPTVSTKLIRVDADGRPRAIGGPLVFPNGMAMTPDDSTLIVAETYAHRLSSFSVSPGGELNDHRTWADLGATTPDGICLDAEGALWVASPSTRELLRVREGGEVLDQVRTFGAPYACTLGGPDGNILYVCTAESHNPSQALREPSGRIEVVNVPIPRAGRP